MYILSDGTITESEAESIMDFLKLNLSISNGAVFNSFQYGKTYFNPSNKASVVEQLNTLISNFNYNITINDIKYIEDKYVTISFKGKKGQLELSMEAI